MKDNIIIGLMCLIVFMSLACLSIISELHGKIRELKIDAIESGSAYHHPKTGVFTWKHKEAGQ